MDPNLEARLKTIEKKLDDTYTMTRKLYRAQRRAMAAKLAYWAFIIIVGIIAVGAIKPYIAQLGEAYGLGGGESTKATDYSDLLKTINQ